MIVMYLCVQPPGHNAVVTSNTCIFTQIHEFDVVTLNLHVCVYTNTRVQRYDPQAITLAFNVTTALWPGGHNIELA